MISVLLGSFSEPGHDVSHFALRLGDDFGDAVDLFDGFVLGLLRGLQGLLEHIPDASGLLHHFQVVDVGQEQLRLVHQH